ncbi:MAG: ATP-binding protein [Rubrivivax sp.]|jgi:two-component system nitrogen regulation sensor histidine kinase GlnL|nr:ATP-binding protein [Rubrivivax sp.]
MTDRTSPLAGFEAFDQLATMIALVAPDGRCLLANAALENMMGVSRRALQRGSVPDWLVDAGPLRETLRAVAANEVASSRFDSTMKRSAALGAAHAELPVHVIVGQTDQPGRLLVEMIEIEQQTRLDREERVHGLAQANKELVRNLAHEIKNPLGGIRGAAQLLAMEVGSRELTEYTQVIIAEADRLQALVDRLLAPHRRPQVVSDVNIHEVCERVRSLVLAEFPKGLAVERDYDTSIPEFRGDREQLIQAVLNIVHNATQALAAPAEGESRFVGRIARGDARIVLRTRVARQATFQRRRFRLALELHVEDNGPGVPESIRDRVFHPLVSGRDGGSGLGLTLAQTFVQQHQGTIECDSVPGCTVFKLLIPLP